MLIKNNNKVMTNLYSKPSKSDRLLNFKSSCPISQKISIINNIKYRITNISNEIFHRENFMGGRRDVDTQQFS